MSKRITVAAVAVMIVFLLTAGASYADSMLTSPPTESDEGLLLLGDESNDTILKKESGQNDVLFVNLKKKAIWGPQAKQEKSKAKGQEYDVKKYSPIYVKCKVYVPAKTSYKYSKKLSSRGSKKTGYHKYASRDITPIIIREAKRNGLSPHFLKAVIQTESNFNPRAVSGSGAMGLCQLMPRTARMLGVTKPFDPEQSIKGGAKYLAMLKKMYKTDELTLAAYNAGPGTVRRAGGVPNIYQTKRYIIKVKRNMKKW